MLPKIEENMWCFNCEHEWKTPDYHNCNSCPKCNSTKKLYRTSSTSFVYAYIEKHPDKEPK